MARIAVGGFQHETNTFSPHLATLAQFEAPDAWPGLTRGHGLFDAVAGINLPAAGFVAEARSLRHSLVPLTWCSAQPSHAYRSRRLLVPQGSSPACIASQLSRACGRASPRPPRPSC